MNRPGRVMIGIVLASGIFFAGYLANRHPPPAASPGSVKQTATYTCPMHPQYHVRPCWRLPVVRDASGTGGR